MTLTFEVQMVACQVVCRKFGRDGSGNKLPLTCVFANNPIGAFVAGRIVWDRTCRSFEWEVRSAKHMFLTTLSFTLSSSFFSYVRKGRCCWCSHHGLHQRYAEWVWLHFRDCGFCLALCIGQEGTSWALLILLVWNVRAWGSIQIQSFWLKDCHMTDDVPWHSLVVKWGLLCITGQLVKLELARLNLKSQAGQKGLKFRVPAMPLGWCYMTQHRSMPDPMLWQLWRTCLHAKDIFVACHAVVVW